MKWEWKKLEDGTHEARVGGLAMVVDYGFFGDPHLVMRIGHSGMHVDYYSRLDAAKRGAERFLKRLRKELNDDATAERLSNQVVKHCEFVAGLTGKRCPMNLHEAGDALSAWAYEVGANERQTTTGVYLCREHESLYFVRHGCKACAAELEKIGDEV